MPDISALQRAALAHSPLMQRTVESLYDGSSGTAEQSLRLLCLSHERLRAELQGTEILLEKAFAKLAAVLALTDPGSEEFRKAFPPIRDILNPRETVPGWRVVERIREVLIGG